MSEVHPKTQPSPLIGALSISASVFVALTSLFVALLAFVAGANQMDTVGMTSGESREPDSAARWWSYGIGVAALVNGFVAGARARKRPPIALATSIIFVIFAVAAGWLFVTTW